MQLKSELKTIKEVVTWRYAVTLSQDKKGIYHVSAKNRLVNDEENCKLIDYAYSNFVFEAYIQSFEGN